MTTFGTIASVLRGEGLASALRRTNERLAEAVREQVLLARGVRTRSPQVPLLIVAAAGIAPRLGGVQTQLAARLEKERAQRAVALLRPGMLELSAPVPHARRVAGDFESGVREALAITGAETMQLEGLAQVPLPALLRLLESGVRVVLSLHDFSLFCARPHLFEEPDKRFCFYSEDLQRCHRCLLQSGDVPADAQRERRRQARRVLELASAVIVPSRFLLEEHRRLFSLPNLQAEIREPGIGPPAGTLTAGRAIAFAGNVKRHKGAQLLPEVARLSGTTIHVFGGGDEDLFRELRRHDSIVVHGYYRAGALPALLVRHGIGLLLFPSIVPESFGLVLSEAWQAGASVAAFDLGAQAARIREHGHGFLAPLEDGAAGLAAIVRAWNTHTPLPDSAAATPPKSSLRSSQSDQEHM